MSEMPIPISAGSHQLGRVLGRGLFKIPDFQRPYSWGEDQLKDLWDDLLDSARPGSPYPHFFGTLLTVDAEGSPLQGAGLQVLDGQQRLTTFTLLLIAIDRHLEELDSPEASKAVRDGVQRVRKDIADVLRAGNGERRLRLRTEDDHVLANLLNGNPGGTGPVGRAFARLKGHVESNLEESENAFGELERMTDAILARSVVIHAHCKAGFDPFVVFSTLNATGLPLTASQILRARALGLVDSLPSHVRDETRGAWDAVESMKDDADRFLQAFLVLRTGDRIQVKDVVRTFDRHVLRSRELPPDREVHFLDIAREMQRLAPIYRQLAAGDWPSGIEPPPSEWHEHRVRLLIKTLNIKQVLPLLVAAAASPSVSFAAVLRIVEQAAFVSIVCLENQTKWGEVTFKLASDVYLKEIELDEVMRVVQQFFGMQLVNPALRFAGRLPEQLRYNGRRKTLIRYFLTTINDWGFGESTSPWRDPDIQATWVLKDIHLDHISAQRGEDDIDSSERDRLGNLTPLKGKANISLSNRPFSQKKSGYGASPLRITRALADLPAWDLDALGEREDAMVSFAAALFCRDLPPIIGEDVT